MLPDLTFGERYDRLHDRLGAADPDPDVIWAMPMVLHLPKAQPPSRTAVLESAARAAILLCLDERAGGDGPWTTALDTWCGISIRKIARRARSGAHWEAAQSVPGVTVDAGGAAVRAIVPSPVTDVDKRISRLQIEGTDLPADEPGPPGEVPVRLWINPHLAMTVGKAAAQAGHGSMLAVRLLTDDQARQWFSAGCPLSVRTATEAQWADLLTRESRSETAAVRDAGFTEIEPGSITVIAERG
ncbi:peptidyl-tRNA hydrolase [Jongsikchunia kroppenstedtii]|uniref:peptidyl-tRNA hydrolase n=1 Tax=Jongsikchunia kroppenstedtii TaxID=1121721 RepID=UPI0003650632|nr:peptidyl-tRNA hydrolase [Jongsikchunia kroppenstedtii]